ncbi:unnamed protein product [Schistosoma curassoni]|uniref:Transposase n=1 Tax=Schistosoma curassoni TaxID=6186 RepID=A0A183KLN1_9TREM|nr:unnamed protein product [Schistosoma curassoni]
MTWCRGMKESFKGLASVGPSRLPGWGPRGGATLPTKGRVYSDPVRSVLLYGCEIWPVRVEDIRRLLVFDHRCLRSVARISSDHRASNAVVRKRVLGKDGKSIDELANLRQLRWLRYVLRMPNHRLPRREMFYDVGVGWKKARGGQTKT